MAGTVTHLVIANRILKLMPDNLKKRIKNEALFYCGNLAPDAIMARENYERYMKLHTHFRDGIGEDELAKPENFSLYRKRFDEFIEEFVRGAKPEEFELYFGYMTHIMADEIFILQVRDRHVDILKDNNPFPDYKSYFIQFGADTDLNDWKLIKEGLVPQKVIELIKSENDYEIKGYITKKELNASKEYIINKNFETEHDLTKNSLLVMYEENYNYINKAVEYIVETLQKMEF